MKSYQLLVVITFSILLSGCFNLPTQSSEITGTYTSGIKYENYDCDRLTTEADSLSRREMQLALAQDQRRKSSKVQAFWIGYGRGDGIEASELANVRGEREAVRTAMERNKCSG